MLSAEKMNAIIVTIREVAVSADPYYAWSHEAPELSAQFNAIFVEDRVLFLELCAQLLADEEYSIRYGTLRLIQSLSELEQKVRRDSKLSVLLARFALDHEDLRSEAVFALIIVGTHATLPAFFYFAERGYSDALNAVRRSVLTPEQIVRGIAISRKYIAAEEYRLREEALFFLQKYSHMDQEAEYLLPTVRKYFDELHIDALTNASPSLVLEPLRAIRATFEEKYSDYQDSAEHVDLSRAIAKLEEKCDL